MLENFSAVDSGKGGVMQRYTEINPGFTEEISDEVYSALSLFLWADELIALYPLRALELLAEPTRFISMTHESAFDAIVRCGLLSDRSLRLLAADCAEWALPNFEKEYPEDKRPRDCIAVVRRFAREEATQEELEAAVSAAYSAAYSAAVSAADSAAGSAVYSAAYSAAVSAAYSAADSAAYSAAGSAAYSAAYIAFCFFLAHYLESLFAEKICN